MRFSKAIWWLRLNLEKPLWGHIGQKCYLGRPAFISRAHNISFGNRVRVYPNARLECGPDGHIKFGDNISVGPNINVTAYNAVEIGTGTTISANVFITDMDHDTSDPGRSVMDTPNILNETLIQENCFIGAGAVILAGTVLERGCVVAANSTVRGKFGPNQVIAGSPANIIKAR